MIRCNTRDDKKVIHSEENEKSTETTFFSIALNKYIKIRLLQNGQIKEVFGGYILNQGKFFF
jgi:hypothetical protein